MEKHTDREKKRTAAALTCLLFALMAGMVIAYAVIADDRIFYFVSVTMMMLTIAAIFIETERKRSRTSEIVIVSTMVTIAVVCRAAFFMLPEIKPAAAVVIISAVCLGERTGFMIGALSMFISNFSLVGAMDAVSDVRYGNDRSYSRRRHKFT